MNCLGMYFYVRYSVSYKKRSVTMETKKATLLIKSGEHYAVSKREMKVGHPLE